MENGVTKLTTIETVLSKITDNSVLMVGGFLGVGTPERSLVIAIIIHSGDFITGKIQLNL